MRYREAISLGSFKNMKHKKFVEFEREKFYPGPRFEPGSLAFRANALTN